MIPGFERFRGGRRLMLGSALAGAAGLAATLALAFLDPRRVAFAYLTAWTFWMGIAAAAVIFLAILHAAHARWAVVFRRTLEAMGLAVLPLAVLFLPVALGMKQIFFWVEPPQSLGHEFLERLEIAGFYLNVPFFLGRQLLYFALFGGVAFLLFRSSVRQDESGDPGLTRAQRVLGAGSLPALGLAYTFAAYDWLLSPIPRFTSQILALYWFGGSLASTLALLAIAGRFARGPALPGSLMTAEHFHALGKLTLAFVAFWAWMAFSQFMLIWIAHLPNEIPFFVARSRGGWGAVGVAVAVGQFALPFLALLSRRLKRTPTALAAVGLWLLAFHYLDLFWVLVPQVRPDAPLPHLADLTAVVGIGGACLGFVIRALRGRFAVPMRDPYLGESVRYRR